MKATEQDFPVVLLIMLYEAGLGFESVDHSNERYCVILSCGAVNYDVQGCPSL